MYIKRILMADCLFTATCHNSVDLASFMESCKASLQLPQRAIL